MLVRWLVVLTTIAVLGASCGDEDTNPEPTAVRTAAPATFEEGPCAVALPAGQQPENVRCGFVTVPEDRSGDGGRTIRLPVMVLKAVGDDVAPDPLVYLSGGPGISAIQSDLPAYEDWFAHPIQLRRDIVFFDQRGTGLSEPVLTCPENEALFFELLAQPLRGRDLIERSRQQNLACRDRLVSEGVNLSAYDSVATVADVVNIMQALGYKEWNLYGFSYGSRIALTAAREQASGLRTIVLDSPVPPQNDSTSRAAMLQRTIDAVVADCVADAACGAAYPGLEQEVWQLVARLEASPVEVEAPTTSGELVPVAMNGVRFIDGILRRFSSGEFETFPRDVHALANGSNAELQAYAQSLAARWGYVADGTLISMICAEEVPFVTLQDVERGAEDVRSEVVEGMQVSGSAFGVDPSGSREDLEGVQAYCEAWGVERSDPVEDEPVVSDLPALILSGQYDPGTPPENGLVTAETLSNSYFVEVPNAGHGEVFSYPLCVLPIVADFLDEPAVEPNTSCIAGVPPVEWALP